MSTQPETVEQFLARGGEIRKVPRGAMAEAGWKDADYAPNSPAMRQRSFDQMREAKALKARIDREEREARKAAKVVEPFRQKAPQRRKAAKPPRAATRTRRKVRKPAKPGPVFAQPGTGMRRVLDAIASPWTTVPALSQATGIKSSNLREYLRLLKARGLVESAGSHKLRLWRLALGEAPPLPEGYIPPRAPAELVEEAFAAVKAGHTGLREIAELTGQNMRSLSTRLHRLKKAGRLTFDGNPQGARWRVIDAPSR